MGRSVAAFAMSSSLGVEKYRNSPFLPYPDDPRNIADEIILRKEEAEEADVNRRAIALLTFRNIVFFFWREVSKLFSSKTLFHVL